MEHHKKNLFKPKLWAQLEKQNDKTLETDGLVWREKDVKEALATFKPEGKKSPEFWLNNKRIEVLLCKELASSKTNGWAKIHNHAIIASLIKDTMLDKGQKQENKVQNEMSMFVEELSNRKNMVDNTRVCNFLPKRDSRQVCWRT